MDCLLEQTCMGNNLIILSSKEEGGGGGGIATTIATISIVNRDLKIVVYGKRQTICSLQKQNH